MKLGKIFICISFSFDGLELFTDIVETEDGYFIAE